MSMGPAYISYLHGTSIRVFVHRREQFVHRREQFVHHREQFVHRREQFVHCREQFVHCREQLVHRKERFGDSTSSIVVATVFEQELETNDRVSTSVLVKILNKQNCYFRVSSFFWLLCEFCQNCHPPSQQ